MTPTQPDTSTSEARASGLAASLLAVRRTTEELAAPLSAEDQTVQSMPDVSPTKWHRGHTSWFFEQFLLQPNLPGYVQHHPMYGFLFNSYYETVGTRHARPERGLVSRPGIDEVAAYRRHVDDAMAVLLARTLDDDTLDLVELGLHHEQQHQELLLMDIKHVLSKNPLLPAYRPPEPPAGRTDRDRGAADADKVQWLDHPGGVVEIGHDGRGFSFDNESPRHAELLVPYALADRPVTCGEWLAFIEDGGYERPELWLSEGWATVQAQHWTAPLYWDLAAAGPSVFTLDGPCEVDPAEPVVHVSYYEADAFARWAGARLPTEAEWEAQAPRVPCGPGAGPDPAPTGLHPGPVGDGGFFGSVWQWTSSSYSPYPGFRAAPGAVGEYNGKFMVNQQVLRGSACITPGGHARPTYRNFFPASARWAFSGLRLARDL